MYVSAGSEGMVRGSRAVGVSWDMGVAQGLRVGVWEGYIQSPISVICIYLHFLPIFPSPTSIVVLHLPLVLTFTKEIN